MTVAVDSDALASDAVNRHFIDCNDTTRKAVDVANGEIEVQKLVLAIVCYVIHT